MREIRYFILVTCFFGTLFGGQVWACKKSVTLSTDKPLAQQMIKKQTTYKVQSNFDLQGETLIIPENSVLSFEGGSIKNGTVVGHNTTFLGEVKCFTNIRGTFNNKFLKTGWFAIDQTDLTRVLTQCIATNVNEIVVSKGVWLVSEMVYLRSDLTLKGEKDAIVKIDRSKVTGPFSLFRLNGTVLTFEEQYKFENITISDLAFEEEGSNELGRTCIVYFCNAKNVHIFNCRFIDHPSNKYAEYVTAAITHYNCKNCVIEKCYTEYVRLVSYGFCVNCTAKENEGHNSPGTWLESCDGYGLVYEDNVLYENIFPGNSSISQNSKNGIIRNNTIIVNGKEVDSMINIGHSSNNVYENSGDGCVVEGNVIRTEYSKGIIAWGSSKTDGLIIRNNQVYAARNHAIYLSPDIQTVYVSENRLTGHTRDQILVKSGAVMSYIQNNHITIDVPGEKYIPLRLRRNDDKGKAIVKGNTIDNGGRAPANTKDETLIDVAIGECQFIDNTVNDGVHFLNVSPSNMLIKGNIFNNVQNVLWHSNNVPSRPLKRFVATDNSINVNREKVGDYLSFFNLYGECGKAEDIVQIERNKIDYDGANDKVKVYLKDYEMNGSFRETTKDAPHK